MSTTYNDLRQLLREASILDGVVNLLSWDQETMMPGAGAGFRAEELAAMERLAHERHTDPRIGDLLARCENDASLRNDPVAAANLREIRRDYDQASKLPAELVERMADTSSRAMQAWKQARENSDFAHFEPWLTLQFELGREKAECLGTPPDGEPYDALLDCFEPGMTGAEVERVFAPLRAELTGLISAIGSCPEHPDTAVHEIEIPIERQRAFNEEVLAAVGFDMGSGRLDVSVHPFSAGVGVGDTRITTRYALTQFAESLGSTLHEAGHGLYEQGLPKREYPGQPLAQAMGLGAHESQSRLWENQVGRSLPFWRWALPLARRHFGNCLDGFEIDDVYRAMNVVQPNLVRIESDEATYNLHIMLRFDLERAMLRGDLAVADLPGAWNDRVRTDLGLSVPDDARGCLQDVHWSMGSIGYFPTYTLGNLYAAQIWEVVSAAMPDLDEQMAAGNFSGLLGWLREHVHSAGRRETTAGLWRRLTGEELDHLALIRHLKGKYDRVYGLDVARG